MGDRFNWPRPQQKQAAQVIYERSCPVPALERRERREPGVHPADSRHLPLKLGRHTTSSPEWRVVRSIIIGRKWHSSRFSHPHATDASTPPPKPDYRSGNGYSRPSVWVCDLPGVGCLSRSKPRPASTLLLRGNRRISAGAGPHCSVLAADRPWPFVRRNRLVNCRS